MQLLLEGNPEAVENENHIDVSRLLESRNFGERKQKEDENPEVSDLNTKHDGLISIIILNGEIRNIRERYVVNDADVEM